MKVVSITKVKDGKPVHDDYNIRSVLGFCRSREGKEIRITYEDYSGNISDEKRRYYEGALIPVLTHWQNKERKHLGLPPYAREDLREIVKKEFNGKMITKNNGQTEKLAQSTTLLSNAGFGRFIDRITQWMEEQQIPVPDPEEYKKWRDSAPPAGQRYFEDIWLPLNDPEWSIMTRPLTTTS